MGSNAMSELANSLSLHPYKPSPDTNSKVHMPENPLTTISQALTMPAKMPILRIQGKLINLTPSAKARRVEGQYGVVFFSDGNLASADGREIIKVSFGLEQPLEDKFVGQLVELACFQSEKHGWVGVTSNDNVNKKTGAVAREVKVTKTGIIKLMSEGPAPAPAPQQVFTQPTLSPQPQSATSGNAEKDFVRKAGRVAFAIRICAKYCDAIARELQWSEEDARAMTNTMFIDMKGTTDFNALPIYDPRKMPLNDPAPPPPPTPALTERQGYPEPAWEGEEVDCPF